MSYAPSSSSEAQRQQIIRRMTAAINDSDNFARDASSFLALHNTISITSRTYEHYLRSIGHYAALLQFSISELMNTFADINPRTADQLSCYSSSSSSEDPEMRYDRSPSPLPTSASSDQSLPSLAFCQADPNRQLSSSPPPVDEPRDSRLFQSRSGDLTTILSADVKNYRASAPLPPISTIFGGNYLPSAHYSATRSPSSRPGGSISSSSNSHTSSSTSSISSSSSHSLASSCSSSSSQKSSWWHVVIPSSSSATTSNVSDSSVHSSRSDSNLTMRTTPSFSTSSNTSHPQECGKKRRPDDDQMRSYERASGGGDQHSLTVSSSETEINMSRRRIFRKITSSSHNRKVNVQHLICTACGSTNTPQWRKGENGTHSLCNACGIHYSNQRRKILKVRK